MQHLEGSIFWITCQYRAVYPVLICGDGHQPDFGSSELQKRNDAYEWKAELYLRESVVCHTAGCYVGDYAD